MSTPTSAIFDILDAASCRPALTTLLAIATHADLCDAADRGLIEVAGGAVSMNWATGNASRTQQLDLIVDVTDAGRDHLRSA